MTWLRLCEATVQVEVQGTNIVVVLRGTVWIGNKKPHGSLQMSSGRMIQKPRLPYPNSETSPGRLPMRQLPGWDGSRVATNCTEQQDRIRLHLMEGLLKQEDGQL